MKKRIFIRNIDPSVTYDELNEQFGYFGYVKNVKIIRHKGIAFVEMSNPHDARQAILGLNDVELKGRPIKVEAARLDVKRRPTQKKTG
jgi:RNA recognition motif-containing protein